MAEPAKKPAQTNAPEQPKVAPQTTTPTTPAVSPRRKKGNPIDKNESKSDRFRRLANRRVPKVLKAMQTVKQLANRATYEWTPEQAAKLVDVLAESLLTVKAAFSGIKAAEDTFKL